MQYPTDPATEHALLGGCGREDCQYCNPPDGLGGKAPGGEPGESPDSDSGTDSFSMLSSLVSRLSGSPGVGLGFFSITDFLGLDPGIRGYSRGNITRVVDDDVEDVEDVEPVKDDTPPTLETARAGLISVLKSRVDVLEDEAEEAAAAAEEEERQRRYVSNATYNAAREKVKKYILDAKHSVQWDDVVGNETAKTALIEAIEDSVVHRDLYKFYDLKPSKGVMLYGPPGCGKTMFAKAVASALARLHGHEVELIRINGPEVQSPWVGKTEEIIRHIFEYAELYHKRNGHQLVIFIDEADSLLMVRDGSPSWNVSNVSTFLSKMDGLEDNGAFVMLATNRPSAIDEALLRDGRCDRKIRVTRPTMENAGIIFKKAVQNTPLTGTVEEMTGVALDYLYDPLHLIQVLRNPDSSLTHHFTLGHMVSGSLIVGLVNRARGIAFRRDRAAGTRKGVSPEDIRQAIDQLLEEEKILPHTHAMLDFIEDTAMPVEKERAQARN